MLPGAGSSAGLPSYRGSAVNNGLSGIPVVNKMVLLSLFALAVSGLMMIFGFWHCRANAFSYSITCTSKECEYVFSNDPKERVVIQRGDLLEAEMVRIKKATGEFVDPIDYRKKTGKSSRTLGYTLRLKYKDPSSASANAATIATPEDGSAGPTSKQQWRGGRLVGEEDSSIKTLMFTAYDLGRRTARKHAKQMQEYIAGTVASKYASEEEREDADGGSSSSSSRSDKAFVRSGKAITAIGIISIFVGFVSMIATCLLGVWEDPKSPRRMKKFS